MSQSSSDLPAPTGGDFILYTAPDGAVMAELFQRRVLRYSMQDTGIERLSSKKC
jgi:hypothetical protein